ncbi:UPF0271 protein [Dethiosulfatibacter aminovorans DSM 17477]|uniref:5-oxoprolinase subunit A n=1 Tax=Dethiosulfatibacter aminovorans DSM 17477 TaxID=1121476 RepID=A0A1M6HE65_9FIRM|nr:5-oxoprolinase subunit PxpA [Dethiosulfatibacter aminovorans]SHJ20424.1 UPF0271 protein [Dethiosulfatibacter aminovorans DSM 17477]
MIIDLNSDLGESFGAYNLGMDSEILKFVSSVNIACGFHAGDPMVMDKTVEMALENNVKMGAHPGMPDLMGFGRRNMNISGDEARNYVIYQVGALKAFVEARGGKLAHVKPHGALYNMAAKDKILSEAIVKAVKSIDPNLVLFGLPGSETAKAAVEIGLEFKNEVFADRGYTDEGVLVPRSQPGAFVKGAEYCADRIARMVQQGEVESVSGKIVKIKADTVCVHGDNDEALSFVKTLRQRLESLGFEIG